MTTYKAFSFGGVALAASIVCLAVSTKSNEAQACGLEPYLGAICFTAATYCPQGWQVANGAAVTISGNEALYAYIGTIYGGDGRTEFQLPDLRGRLPLGDGKGTGLVSRTVGQKVGTEGAVLTPAAMPAHTHAATFVGTPAPVTITPTVQASTLVGNSTVPSTATPTLGAAPNLGLAATRKIWSAAQGAAPVTVGGTNITVSALPSGGGGATVTNASMGGGNAFANAPPQLALLTCVATQGLFPQNGE